MNFQLASIELFPDTKSIRLDHLCPRTLYIGRIRNTYTFIPTTYTTSLKSSVVSNVQYTEEDLVDAGIMLKLKNFRKLLLREGYRGPNFNEEKFLRTFGLDRESTVWNPRQFLKYIDDLQSNDISHETCRTLLVELFKYYRTGQLCCLTQVRHAKCCIDQHLAYLCLWNCDVHNDGSFRRLHSRNSDYAKFADEERKYILILVLSFVRFCISKQDYTRYDDFIYWTAWLQSKTYTICGAEEKRSFSCMNIHFSRDLSHNFNSCVKLYRKAYALDYIRLANIAMLGHCAEDVVLDCLNRASSNTRCRFRITSMSLNCSKRKFVWKDMCIACTLWFPAFIEDLERVL